MKHRSPISLFSFQDIITCLTGIMIVVVLVLLLEVVNSAAKRAARSALNAERIEVLQLEKELLQQREVAQRHLNETQARLRENRPPDAAELLQRRTELETEDSANRTALAEARRLAETLTAERDKTQKRTLELAELQKQLRDARQEHETLQGTLRKQRERFQIQETEWVKGRTPLRIEFLGSFERVPMLAECTGNAIVLRDANAPAKILCEFRSDAPAMNAEIDHFLAYLDTRSPEREYPVLLVRAEAAGYLDALLEKLRSKNWTVGFEPLGKREEIR